MAIILATAAGCALPGRHRMLRVRLDRVLHQLDSTGAVVAARVLELPSGRELYAADIDAPLTPASNLKLLVSAAALDRFGPDHAFKTYLVQDGDDLWVIGTGDPGIGDPLIAQRRGGTTTTVLDDWAKALQASGINRIRGKLVYYDGALEAQWVHPTWHQDDLTQWYAAPVSGLNFNDNCIDITIWPTAPGQPVRYEVVPPTSGIRIINNCITGEKQPPDCQRAPTENVYTLVGGCTARTRLKSKPVVDPGAFFADALRTHLQARGIVIDGPTVRAADDAAAAASLLAGARIVAVHQTKLGELLPRINKNSQNLLAEGLCKLLGQAYEQDRGIDRPGSWRSGEQAVREFLRANNIDDNCLVLADGSGLSRSNKLTVRIVSDLLLSMRSHQHGQVFFDSLAIGGRDGTISGRFRDAPEAVHAKTGYISGVRALSGYVRARDGRWFVLSIIYNNIPGGVRPFEHLQDEAARLLMSWPRLDYRPVTTRPATAPTTQPN